jgi:hypothetical protein
VAAGHLLARREMDSLQRVRLRRPVGRQQPRMRERRPAVHLRLQLRMRMRRTSVRVNVSVMLRRTKLAAAAIEWLALHRLDRVGIQTAAAAVDLVAEAGVADSIRT